MIVMLFRSRKKGKHRRPKNKAKGRLLAAKIAVILIVTLFAVAFLPADNAVRADADKGKTKSETVYAILEDDGTYSGATVVNCFTAQGQITDYGDYNSVTNLMGAEKPTVKGEKIIWDVDAVYENKSFYYEGETDKPLPFDIKIEYYLNGKKTQPDDIAGKTGELKIAFMIVNKAETGQFNELVDKQIYTPFAMQVSAVFDSDIFTVIDIPKNASSMRMGSSYNLSYSSFPLPEDEFSFTLFGQGIKMDPINIIALPKAPPGLDSYDDFIDKDGLSEGTDEMIEGTDEMSQGTDELLDGLYEMKDAAKELQSGLEDLSGGADSLESGNDTLYSNARTLSSSAADFYAGMSAFSSSFAVFDQGMGALYTGVLEMSSTLSDLNDAASLLDGGVVSMKTGLDGVLVSNEQLKTLSDIVTAAHPDANTAALYNGLDAQQNAINALAAAGADLKTLSASVASGTNSFYTEFSTTFCDNVYALRTSSGTLYASCLELLSGADRLNGACSALKGAVKELSKGAQSLSGGAGEAANAMPEFINAIDDMIEGVTELNDGIQELSQQGLSEMKNSLDGLDGYLQALSDKADEYGSFMDERNAKNSTVQFVIKTGGISAEEEEEAIQVSADSEASNGFFDKLKDLF